MGTPLDGAWTVVTDDVLCERFRVCVVCTAPAQRLDVLAVAGQLRALSRCQRCRDRDPHSTALLAQRTRTG